MSCPALWFALCLPPTAPSSPTPEALACWAGRFTPRVALASGCLLFEVAASRRLFGGLERLAALVRADLDALAPELRYALAPTPRAASWLAREARRRGEDRCCVNSEASRAALAALPVADLDLPPPLLARIQGFGIGRLGEAMALPRAGLGRRLGAGFVLDLARALGEVPEPLAWFEFPEHFEAALELPAPVEAAPVLAFAAQRLLASLTGWLTARQAALREMHWRIDHGHGAATELPLRFSRPVHAVEPMLRVLRERLAALRLTAPALGLGLSVTRCEALDDASVALFAGAEEGREDFADLLDRLQARLGEAAVRGVSLRADHRPERATVWDAPGAAKVGAGETANLAANPAFPPLSRPLLLAEPPERLAEVDGRPRRRGPLRLVAGPERIESGWWDGAPVRRDYFVALDATDAWLWIYRDPRHDGGRGAWFLHGWFA